MLMRDEEGRKKEASKVIQTKSKATKNELPRVGLEPTTLYTLDRALNQLATKAAQLAGPKS